MPSRFVLAERPEPPLVRASAQTRSPVRHVLSTRSLPIAAARRRSVTWRRSDLKTLSEILGFDEWCAEVMALLAHREEQEREQTRDKTTLVARFTTGLKSA
jgi:hypothetical protein